MLPSDFCICPVKMLVLQLSGDLTGGTPLQIRCRSVNCKVCAVGFGSGSKEDHRLCNGNPSLRQAKLQCRIHAGFYNGHGLGVSKPHILRCNY